MLLLFAMVGCSSTYHTTSSDDIYYIPKTSRGEPEQVAHAEGGKVVEVVEETEAYSQPAGNNHTHNTDQQPQGVQYVNTEVVDDTAEYYYDDNGNQVVVHNHYYGDYYDFSYASRIRRFHRPYVSFGYYDPFFTNMYFYTFNPHYYGVSIYMGYGAMPFYYPGFYWHRPWYSSWYWRPHYWHRPFHPFYYYGFGGWWGSPFWSGYHAGFYAGMHYPFGYGHWGYYGFNYNSFDGSNYHYGPRGSMGGTVDRSGTGRHTTSSPAGSESFADRFESRTTVNEDGRREILADNRSGSSVEEGETAQRQQAQPERQSETLAGEQDAGSRATSPAATQPKQITAQERAREMVADQQRTDREAYQPVRRVEDYRAPSREQYGTTTVQRYTRPQQVSPQRRTDGGSSNYTMPRTYTSPSYQQPSTPQRTRPAPATTTRPSRDQAAPSRQPTQTRPATPPPSQRPSAQPSRSDDRGRPSYTPPRQQPSSRSTTSPARSTPPRSSASPARSTPPRSSASPARSSSSRGSSSPARSSGSSSSRSGSSGGRNR